MININQFRSVRVKFGLRQEDLAKIIGCAEATFSRKEKGYSSFTLNEAKKIKEYINSLDKNTNYIIEDIFF